MLLLQPLRRQAMVGRPQLCGRAQQLLKPAAVHKAQQSQQRSVHTNGCLVDPDFVDAQLSATATAVRSSHRTLILDCGHPISFQRAHIPSAVSFGLAMGGLKEQKQNAFGMLEEHVFKQLVEMLQLTNDTTIVLYDDQRSLNAVRAWWVFQHYGFPKLQLKVLNGGWKSWIRESKRIMMGASVPPLTLDSSASLFNPKVGKDLVDLDQLLQLWKVGAAQFVDTRSQAEFQGQQAMANRRAGHIPRAVHFEWSEAMDDYEKFRDPQEIRQLLTERGLGFYQWKMPLVTYCQRGIRAAHTAFVLHEILGLDQVLLYEHSMAEYLNRTETPLER